MLHNIQVMTVAIFDHILGVLNIAEGFVTAHHSDHDGDTFDQMCVLSMAEVCNAAHNSDHDHILPDVGCTQHWLRV